MTPTRLWHMGEALNLAAEFGAACREANILLVRARHAATEQVRSFYLKDARYCGARARECWKQLQALEVEQ
jgi:hypothetical protein